MNLSLFRLNSLVKDAPTIVWVAHSWGLPRSTWNVSNPAPSLWHFQGCYSISKDVGILPAVNHIGYLDLCLHQARTLQTSQFV